MGFNSTIVILNDTLHMVGKDKEFGAKVEAAVLKLNISDGKPVDIDHGAVAIETHHADSLIPVLVGGNCGYKIEKCYLNYRVLHEDGELGLELLKELAGRYGYYLRKKPTSKRLIPISGK